ERGRRWLRWLRWRNRYQFAAGLLLGRGALRLGEPQVGLEALELLELPDLLGVPFASGFLARFVLAHPPIMPVGRFGPQGTLDYYWIRSTEDRWSFACPPGGAKRRPRRPWAARAGGTR